MRLDNCNKKEPFKALKEEWSRFKPQMESLSFIIDSIINEVQFEEVLIDNGCQSYASISDKFVRKHKPNSISTQPRVVEGFLPGVRSTVTQAAKFDIDMVGLKKSIWAYVVLQQVQNMMLGRAFLVNNAVHINEASEALEFERSGHVVPNKQQLAKLVHRPSMITSRTYISIVKKGNHQKKRVETYSITLADIDKALAPKKVVDPTEHTPKWLCPEFENSFQPKEANKLPVHHPKIDHQIPLETDNNGIEKPVPWCAMYNNSCDELLVLRKTLTDVRSRADLVTGD